MYNGKAYPYYIPNHTLPDRELKNIFSQVMAEMPGRIQNISDYLYMFQGVRLTPRSTFQELDQLPYLIGKLGGFRKVSDEEVAASLEAKKPFAKQVLFEILERIDFDDETYRMLFDGALLWGAAFQQQYPSCNWFVGQKPKSSAYFGFPVLKVVEGEGVEFCPIDQLEMLTFPIIDGKDPKSTISYLTRKRAESLHLISRENASHKEC